MNKKLTKALAITILASMTMVGCGTPQKQVEDKQYTTPKQVQQIDNQAEPTEKPVEQSDKSNNSTTQVNKPTQNKTTDKTVKTVKPNATQENKTKTTAKPKAATNNSNVTSDDSNNPNNPNNSNYSVDDNSHTGWSSDGNYYDGEPVSENEQQYYKQHGHFSQYDDGEWNYNPYTGETRE